MKTNHTPGPWLTFGHHVTADDPNRSGYTVAVAHVPNPSDNVRPAIGTREANAALIAAAPELLEALANLNYLTNCKCNNEEAPQPHCDCCTCEGSRMAVAAIAKARGEAVVK